MSILFALTAVFMVAISIPLCFVAPVIVFYMYLIATVFSNLFYGYIAYHGNMGMPRAWGPADFMCLMAVIAYLRVRPVPLVDQQYTKRLFFVIVMLSILGLIIGAWRNLSFMLPATRYLHFIPAFLFASRYMVTEERVMTFFRFAIVLLFSMFLAHVAIRFNVFSPPTAMTEDLVRGAGQLEGSRGGRTLAPSLYLLLTAIPLAAILSNRKGMVSSLFLVVVSIGGIALSETRSLMAAWAIIPGVAFFMGKKKFKYVFVVAVGTVCTLVAFSFLEYDVLARFRYGYESGAEFVGPLDSYQNSWRAQEFGMLASSYASEPYYLLSGRGVGAMHEAPDSARGFVDFYHCDYLGYLDVFGLIGFIAILFIWIAGLNHSFRALRYPEPSCCFIGKVVFLFLLAVAANAVFHPELLGPRTGTIVASMLAIAANLSLIRMHHYQPVEMVSAETWDTADTTQHS